jgi:tudor domain-containing protein 5
MMGTRIPYRELGYKTLEQFLKSLPDVSVTLGHGGEMILSAIPNKKSKHISALVSKQKSSSKKFKSTGKNVSTVIESVHYRSPLT